MSYGPSNLSASGGNRSPRTVRRSGELPTVDRSPSRNYPPGRGSPLGPKSGRTRSPDQHVGSYQVMNSPYYREDDMASPVPMDDRNRTAAHHRSRSASRPPGANPMTVRYQSLDRGGVDDRDFLPVREPRERSLERINPRERSMDRTMYMEDELYGPRSARQSPNARGEGAVYLGELQHQNNDLQRELANLKKELELTNQKLGSSMHSIKTFWSPELKKERALRKEESAKYSLINDQLKLLNSENQKQAMLVRQLEDELRLRMRGPSLEMQQQMEVLYSENEHLTREIAILRETIKELELRIETQKQTLTARDESIKKLLEMLQNKGVGNKMIEMGDGRTIADLEALLIESEHKIRHYESILRNRDQELNMTRNLDEFRSEIQRREQELLAMGAKMKTLEDQHQDYQRHISVLKESLCAKEEHYNMLQADVDELRQRLEEKNRLIEKKTQAALQATQEKNRMSVEVTEMKDHMDIKDRKINVLQRKIELHEAKEKLATGAAKAGEESSSLKKQLEEQKRQLEEQRRKLEEHRKGVDIRVKQLEEKERSIADLELKLKKRKEKMDQLERDIQRNAGGGGENLAKLEHELQVARVESEKLREDAKHSQEEMERLLQLVQMSQEEQNSKEKTIRELQEALKNAQAKLRSQQTTNAQREQQRRAEEDGQVLCEDNSWEDMMEVVRIKEERIEELEEALRESVRITAGRERGLQEEEVRRKNIMEKVGKLEQRLLSLQTAHALRCSTCRPLLTRLQQLEKRLTQLLEERTHHLRELTHMKQEALEAAISEKDAHLALLEIAGLRTGKQAEQAEILRADRARLMDKLKHETEVSIKLLHDYSSTDNFISATNDKSETNSLISPMSVTSFIKAEILDNSLYDDERTVSTSEEDFSS